MIKVIAGFKVKRGEDIQALLLKLRSHAMTFRGYIGSENLIADKDTTIIAVANTWENVIDWKDWESSSIALGIMKEIRKALVEEPRITVYRIMPTTGWSYAPRSS